jgi:isocitrate/isopropylmalate dehydrogenase
MMLDYIGERDIARNIEAAIHGVYRERKCLTRDLGGTATTAEFTGELIAALNKPTASSSTGRSQPVESR